MRKLAALLALVLSFASPALAFAGNAILSLDPGTGTFNQGCTVSVNVRVDTGGAQTDGTDAILTYDPSIFNVTSSSIQNGSIYSDYPGNSVDPTGKIAISGLASVSQAYTTAPGTSGVLATINFAVRSDAPLRATTVAFDFDPNNKTKTTDSNVVERSTVADVLNSVNNGTYTIGTGACGTTSTSTQTVTTGSGTKTPVGGTAVDSKQGFSTPSALLKTGDSTGTFVLVVVGSVLTVLGIVGLAVL